MWRVGAVEEEEIAVQGVLDVRLHASAWLTPFSSLGVQVGRSVLRADEQVAMVTFAISVFAWDGLR